MIVEPESVDDTQLPGLASAIAKHIEADLSYPGEIKVTVLREVRAGGDGALNECGGKAKALKCLGRYP